MEASTALPLIWAGVIAFGVTLYVLLDGFSLGVGILFPFADEGHDRATLMATVVPVWDGNQTWLVLGGASLFAAFPSAFNTLLSAFYLPLIVMLLALVFRGAAFEFRGKAADPLPWDWAFALGSVVAAFCQGWVLGRYILGPGRADVIGFAAFTGAAVVCAYALLGCCWLVLKTRADLNGLARAWGRRLLGAVLVGIAGVSAWTPLAEPAIADRWFAWPNTFLLAPVPVLTIALAVTLYNSLLRGSDHGPFFLCLGLYLLTLSGLAISLWPYIVPRTVTVWQATSPPDTQLFLLYGVAIILPLVLVYTAHAYYVFRGKVTEGEGY